MPHEVAPDSMGEPGGFGFRLLVSPSAGRIKHLPLPGSMTGYEWVSRGQAVVLVEQGPSRRGEESHRGQGRRDTRPGRGAGPAGAAAGVVGRLSGRPYILTEGAT